MHPGFEDRLEPIPGTPLQRSHEALQSYNIAKLQLDLRRQPPLQVDISNIESGKLLVEQPRLEKKPSKDKRCRLYNLSTRTFLLLATIITIIIVGAAIAGSLGGSQGRRRARPSSADATLHNVTLTIMDTAPLVQSTASSPLDPSKSSSIHTSTFQIPGSQTITLGAIESYSTTATPTFTLLSPNTLPRATAAQLSSKIHPSRPLSKTATGSKATPLTTTITSYSRCYQP